MNGGRHSGRPISFSAMNRAVEQRGTRAGGLPVLSDARRLSDEELAGKLHALGIPAEKQWLRDRCEAYRSAEEMALACGEENHIEARHSDWLWFCLTVLWDRWCPDVPNLEIVDERMQLGYRKLEGKDTAAACDAWLSCWQAVLQLMERWKIDSIAQFDREFCLTGLLFNWCQDFEMELGNAGVKDLRYVTARLEYCRKVIPLLGPEEQLSVENMRRAIAESLVGLGDAAEADRLYEEWLAADPRWGWGWIGWSDMHWTLAQGKGDPQRAEQILLRGLEVSGLKDRADVLERLSELYEDTGRKEEAQQTAASASRERSRSVGGGRPAAEAEGSASRGFPVVSAADGAAVSPAGKRKIGRNEPCPCGSGKKYKRCCGA